MKDNAFYFSHDYNARNDSKIKKLLSKHGYLGYGLFWALVEELYNNANALPTDYESIAFDLRTNPPIIESIINDFDLFVVNENLFGSTSIERRLNERIEKSKKARDSANERWKKLRNNANALQPQSDSNAIKESKGKESKENKSINYIHCNISILEKKISKFSPQQKEKITELLQMYFSECVKKEFPKSSIQQKLIIESIPNDFSFVEIEKNITEAISGGYKTIFFKKSNSQKPSIADPNIFITPKHVHR